MEVEQYSEKSIAVFGNYSPWANDLLRLGGRPNANLRGRPGYIFGLKSAQAVVDFVNQANAGQVMPTVGAVVARPVMLGPVATPAPMVARTAVAPALSPRTAVLQATQAAPAYVAAPLRPAVQPVAQLPGTATTVNYPNLFTAADGLTYQIMVITVPLPEAGQRVHLAVGDVQIPYHISEVEKAYSALMLKDGTDTELSRIVIIGDKWQICGFDDAHEILFFKD